MRPKAEGLDRLAMARALREIGRLLDLAGAEPFKARVYERGAGVLERADLAPLGHGAALDTRGPRARHPLRDLDGCAFDQRAQQPALRRGHGPAGRSPGERSAQHTLDAHGFARAVSPTRRHP